MTATTLTQAEGDDFTTANDFRSVGIVVDPTTLEHQQLQLHQLRRQTYIVKVDTNSGTFEPDESYYTSINWCGRKVVEFDSTLSLLFINKRSSKVLEQMQHQVDMLHLVEQTK